MALINVSSMIALNVLIVLTMAALTTCKKRWAYYNVVCMYGAWMAVPWLIPLVSAIGLIALIALSVHIVRMELITPIVLLF